MLQAGSNVFVVYNETCCIPTCRSLSVHSLFYFNVSGPCTHIDTGVLKILSFMI